MGYNSGAIGHDFLAGLIKGNKPMVFISLKANKNLGGVRIRGEG